MRSQKYFKTELAYVFITSFLWIAIASQSLKAQTVLTPEDVLKTKSCGALQLSPDGEWIAYTVRVPRDVDDKAGGAYSELYLVSVKTGDIKPFITGKVNVSSPQWSPDGSSLAFRMKRGDKAKTQVWTIPVTGGESRKVTNSKSGVISFHWHPQSNKIAYTATTPKSKKEKKLADKGYGFIYFEENLKHRNLYLIDLTANDEYGNVEQLTHDATIWDFVFSPDGKSIAASISPKNLIDHRYMFRKIHLIDIESKKTRVLTDNPGKLGNYAFSPDGKKLAYCAALTREDHQVSQAFVIDTKGGDEKILTIPDFLGHVNWVGWKDDNTVMYRSGEGVWSTLSTVNGDGGKREIILHSSNSGVIFRGLSFDKNTNKAAFIGSSPQIPGDIYCWEPGKSIKRITTLNPWLENRNLGKQDVVKYKARDGLNIEGLLIYPVDYKSGQKYPLIVYVHGGPESHYYNSYTTRYSTPGQVMAGKGYAVFYPNYRASTGYGVKFSMEGLGDPGGKEFDDIADGIEHLVKIGVADADRVGLAGGSYGGYASAWFATYYTKYVKAVCMFVGISDLISKRGTTDITYEELYVHSGKMLEEMWDLNLKRSPIFWAHQSKTAVLIYGGASDTRVHPSQSLELYYRLKMNNHPAVRLVQYPGEGHGNAKQPGRTDVLYRQIQWLDWYVYDWNPLNGPMPPLDISESYGIDLSKK